MPKFLVGLHRLQLRAFQRPVGATAIRLPRAACIDIAERMRGAVILKAQAVIMGQGMKGLIIGFNSQ